MERDEIKTKVISILSNLFPDPGIDKDVLECVDLQDDLGMDSITFISIVVEVEAHFNIEIPDNILLLENFQTVDAIISVVETELMKKLESVEVRKNVET